TIADAARTSEGAEKVSIVVTEEQDETSLFYARNGYKASRDVLLLFAGAVDTSRAPLTGRTGVGRPSAQGDQQGFGGSVLAAGKTVGGARETIAGDAVAVSVQRTERA